MAVLAEIFVPKETVSDEFATVAKLYVHTGDSTQKGEVLIDLETSKTVVSIQAEADGFVEVFCHEGDDVTIGSLLIKITDNAIQNNAEIEANSTKTEIDDIATDTIFSKKALLLIEKNNILKSKFSNMDFVNEEDVLNLLYPEKACDSKKEIKKSEVKENTKVITYDQSLVTVEPLSKIKKTEIQYLTDVQSGVMNSVLNVAVDIKNIDEAINQSFKIFSGSYLPLIVYEISRLLTKYRVFNAFFTGDGIAYYNRINVGMATDFGDGLKVLTLPDTNNLNMSTVETGLYQLIEKYLDKKLDVADVTGSTFTITDLSTSGVDFFTPLINTKQSAILGISKVDPKLNRFYLTLVFDHRVTEGKIASEFLVELKQRIESYSLSETVISDSQNNEAIFLDIKCGTCFKTLQEDKELKGIGMIKIVNHQGHEDYICQDCFAGY